MFNRNYPPSLIVKIFTGFVVFFIVVYQFDKLRPSSNGSDWSNKNNAAKYEFSLELAEANKNKISATQYREFLNEYYADHDNSSEALRIPIGLIESGEIAATLKKWSDKRHEQEAAYSREHPPSPMEKWNSYSTGYTWATATHEEKSALCQNLARVSRYGNSAGYFYESLDAFYNDSSTKSVKLNDAVSMVDAGSKALRY